MKKKMTILAVLVAAVVITGYSVAGTYAKYTTTLSAESAQAKVARWSFKINNGTEIKNLNLFQSTYSCTTSAGASCVQALKKSNDTSLGTELTKPIVAPGTQGEAEIQLSIDSETAFTLNFGLKGTDGNKVKLSTEEVKSALGEDSETIEKLKTAKVLESDGSYSPIKFSLKAKENAKVEGISYSDFATGLNGLITKLSENSTYKDRYFLQNGGKVVTSNGKPVFKPVSKKEFATPITIGWSWRFEYIDESDSDSTLRKAVNVLDTALTKKGNLTIDFAVEITAEQVQDVLTPEG